MNDEFFQKLYDNEIPFQVSSIWDAGFDVRIGDGAYTGNSNDWKETQLVSTWEEVKTALKDMVRRHYSYCNIE